MFGDKYYMQIEGVPMGNPLSPKAAEITLDHLLDMMVLLVKVLLGIDILYLKKYVDDLFLCIPKAVLTQI